MKKLKSIKQLKNKADAVFSIWIRERDKRCYTCMRVIPVKELQCGHYVSRSYLALRYDEKNAHAQCVSCNVFKHGNMTVYAIQLINEYGVDILTDLERRKRESVKTRQFLEAVIDTYGHKTNN